MSRAMTVQECAQAVSELLPDLPRLREERSRRCDSTFQLGLRWLTRLLTNEQHVPCLLHLWAEKAAPLKLS
jgi:hypothetical protein